MSVRPGYALVAVALLGVEVAITCWVRDRFVRPVGGDILAVMLAYCALRAVTRLRIVPAAILATAIGFAVEAGQAVHLAERNGLADHRVLRTVLGQSFAVEDLVAYLVGGAASVLIECLRPHSGPVTD